MQRFTREFEWQQGLNSLVYEYVPPFAKYDLAGFSSPNRLGDSQLAEPHALILQPR